MTITACKHCPNTTMSSRDVARIQGWRFFDGTNQAGLPMTDVACPRCSGCAPAQAEPEPEPTWKVRCTTCGYDTAEDVDIDEPIDGPNAVVLAELHRCEPWVEIQPPGHDSWNVRGAFNRDGSWRNPDPGASVSDFRMAVTS